MQLLSRGAEWQCIIVLDRTEGTLHHESNSIDLTKNSTTWFVGVYVLQQWM